MWGALLDIWSRLLLDWYCRCASPAAFYAYTPQLSPPPGKRISLSPINFSNAANEKQRDRPTQPPNTRQPCRARSNLITYDCAARPHAAPRLKKQHGEFSFLRQMRGGDLSPIPTLLRLNGRSEKGALSIERSHLYFMAARVASFIIRGTGAAFAVDADTARNVEFPPTSHRTKSGVWARCRIDFPAGHAGETQIARLQPPRLHITDADIFFHNVQIIA